MNICTTFLSENKYISYHLPLSLFTCIQYKANILYTTVFIKEALLFIFKGFQVNNVCLYMFTDVEIKVSFLNCDYLYRKILNNILCFSKAKFIPLLQYIDSLLFLVVPRSPKTCSQNISTFSLSPVSGCRSQRKRLAADKLKFLYLSCYDVSITNQFHQQPGKAQCFDCKKICVCAQQFQVSKY